MSNIDPGDVIPSLTKFKTKRAVDARETQSEIEKCLGRERVEGTKKNYDDNNSFGRQVFIQIKEPQECETYSRRCVCVCVYFLPEIFIFHQRKKKGDFSGEENERK